MILLTETVPANTSVVQGSTC